MAQVCGHMAGGRAMWAAVAAAAAAVLAALAAASDCGVATGAASLSDPMWTGFHNTLVGNVRQEDGGPNVRQDVAPFACSVYPEPALYVLPVCFTSCADVACMHEVVWRVRRAARTSYSTVTASRSSGAARSGGATPGWATASPACSSSTSGATAPSLLAAPVRAASGAAQQSHLFASLVLGTRTGLRIMP